MADIKMDFNGDVSIEKMFDIHNNQNVTINNNTADKEKLINFPKEISEEDKTTEVANLGDTSKKEIFHFVHPALEEEDGWKVHREVERLVKRFDVQVICMRLNQLKKEGKVLLPQNTKNAHEELKRMGMPTEKAGFEYKTFCKYYHKD